MDPNTAPIVNLDDQEYNNDYDYQNGNTDFVDPA